MISIGDFKSLVGHLFRRHTPLHQAVMFRNIRNFLSHSRIPVRISAQSDKYKLYRVRFVPQDKRFNGLFRGLLLLSGCHIAANTLLQTFGSGWEEPLFIPLGFLEEGPRRRYELTDPEFQAFLKFNKDTKRALAARGKCPLPVLEVELYVESSSLAS